MGFIMCLFIPFILREWLRLKKIAAIKKLCGKLAIADNLEILKETELKKLEKLHEFRSR
jgi:hypothetical protein